MSDSQTKKEFEEEQASRAEAQNLTADNAVPEQRPQASQVFDGPKESELSAKLREAGDPSIGVDEPMEKADYDRAASDSQAKKAEKDSITEGLMVGNVAIATKGPHEGRVFAVTRVVSHRSPEEALRAATGSPEQLYNQPDELELRAIGDERDGELIVLGVDEAGLEKQNEGWRGTRAGRRH